MLNKIESLPVGIGKMSSLERLKLSVNQVTPRERSFADFVKKIFVFSRRLSFVARNSTLFWLEFFST
jgi:hypothetical protein